MSAMLNIIGGLNAFIGGLCLMTQDWDQATAHFAAAIAVMQAAKI